MTPITVTFLGKGFDDLAIVNAARVSFAKESKEFSGADQRLLDYLWFNEHTSPFRHAHLSMHCRAPVAIARQIHKHVVGCSNVEDGTTWNEESGRYVSHTPEVYIPEVFHSRPENVKQGAGEELGLNISRTSRLAIESRDEYERLIGEGVAPEEARFILPMGHIREWRMCISVAAALHMLDLRLDSHAQREAQEFARQLEAILKEQFPGAHHAWKAKRDWTDTILGMCMRVVPADDREAEALEKLRKKLGVPEVKEPAELDKMLAAWNDSEGTEGNTDSRWYTKHYAPPTRIFGTSQGWSITAFDGTYENLGLTTSDGAVLKVQGSLSRAFAAVELYWRRKNG